jgi:FAD/FMN-containing dehydrogenase
MSEATPFVILRDAEKHRRIHPHEDFCAAKELERKLRASAEGEVRFDKASRALYATDASNYRQVAIGLVIPKSEADVIATVAAFSRIRRPNVIARRRY